MTTSAHAFVGFLGGCLLASCVQATAPNNEGDKSTESATKPAPPSQPTPAQPPKTDSHRAWVGVDGVGLHVIDEHGWRVALETRAPVRDLLEFNGQLFVLSAFGVQHAGIGQGETVAEIKRDIYSQIGDPLALATADGREFWVAGPLGVAHYTDTWQVTPVAATNPNPTNIDVAVDRTGGPWLLYGSLFHHHGGSWQPLADTSITSPLALLPDPRNDVMLAHAGCQADARACVVSRVTADAAPTRIELPVDECTDYGMLAMSPDGLRAVLAGRCGLVRFELVGDAKPVRLGLDAGWPGQPLHSLALDARGRVWASTNNSVMIIAADGQIADYPIAQLGDIAGPVGPLLVQGDGPEPPTLGRERTGGLAGVIVVLDGETKKPLPGVSVELCRHLPPAGERPPDPDRSPCAGVESTQKTTTDDDGRFQLASVPIGHYYFGVEIDGRWARGQPKSMTMRAGMDGNVGKVVVAVPN
jgi:hypothetical protein